MDDFDVCHKHNEYGVRVCSAGKFAGVHDSTLNNFHHYYVPKDGSMPKTMFFDLTVARDRAAFINLLDARGSWVNSLSALVEKMGGTMTVELPEPEYQLKDDGGGCRVVQEESGHIYFLNEQNRAALGFPPSELDGLIARLQELKGE